MSRWSWKPCCSNCFSHNVYFSVDHNNQWTINCANCNFIGWNVMVSK